MKPTSAPATIFNLWNDVTHCRIQVFKAKSDDGIEAKSDDGISHSFRMGKVPGSIQYHGSKVGNHYYFQFLKR